MPDKDTQSIDLNHLRTLMVLYQEGSVQATAERLRITSPAVSYSLKKLREALNDALFVRTNRGLSPTARAHSIMKELPDLVGNLDTLLHRTPSFDPTQLALNLNIAIPEVMGCWLIPRIYHRLKQEAPGVLLTSSIWTSNSLKRLEEEELNLGIHLIDEHPKSLIQTPLFDVTPTILCNNNHPLMQEKRLTLESLSQHSFLVHELPNYSTYIAPFELIFKKHGYTAKIGARIGQLSAALKMLKESDLIMFTALEYIPCLGDHIDHIAVPPQLHAMPLQVKAFYHSRQGQNPAYCWLLDIIRDEIHQQGLSPCS
ncbi:LysR family transcriptional regulator [Endozoicomonas sp. Mp262]|uniref:LysR family transcriptional regulator n=1 Tax=Endozoicomonas sp. Mp262 TaxID=2919499 RepID=UPI0021DA6C96